MIQKNPFLKYMMKEQKADIAHSSAYAKAQNGGNFGSASTESFDVRVNINQNRTRVKAYNDSRLVAEARTNAPKAKVAEPQEKIVKNRSELAVGKEVGGDKAKVGRLSGATDNVRATGNTVGRTVPTGSTMSRSMGATKRPAVVRPPVKFGR